MGVTRCAAGELSSHLRKRTPPYVRPREMAHFISHPGVPPWGYPATGPRCGPDQAPVHPKPRSIPLTRDQAPRTRTSTRREERYDCLLEPSPGDFRQRRLSRPASVLKCRSGGWQEHSNRAQPARRRKPTSKCQEAGGIRQEANRDAEGVRRRRRKPPEAASGRSKRREGNCWSEAALRADRPFSPPS